MIMQNIWLTYICKHVLNMYISLQACINDTVDNTGLCSPRVNEKKCNAAVCHTTSLKLEYIFQNLKKIWSFESILNSIYLF